MEEEIFPITKGRMLGSW
jgi:hypothetical protein